MQPVEPMPTLPRSLRTIVVAAVCVGGCALPAADDGGQSEAGGSELATAPRPTASASESAPPSGSLTAPASCGPEAAAPASIPGSKPINASLLDHAGKPISFPCFGGCGASCELQERVESVVRACQDSSCGPTSQHRVLSYRSIEGASHEFCSWHDSCYLKCSEALENDSPDAYSRCTRWCDFGCVSPENWDRSRIAGDYDPAFFSRTVMGGAVFETTGSDDDRRRAIAITQEAGPLPPVTWDTGACLVWAASALGSNPVTDLGPSTGRVTFTELVETAAWSDGTCAGSEPALPLLAR